MESLNDILSLDSNAKVRTFKKGHILQQPGVKNPFFYFVKSGLLRSYLIDKKGKEHTYLFATEGWLVADIESQEFNFETELFIECLEHSEVIAFDKNCFKVAKLSLDQLKSNVSLLTRRVGVLQRRVLMLMSTSAKERYEHFLEMYPDLPNRIPQHMIASYLGITPQSLSTIRSEM